MALASMLALPGCAEAFRKGAADAPRIAVPIAIDETLK